ncbi:MAG TPA: trypsin-like peptidase domain-containing protein, partial [Candidatus Udaeobacter sp.]|nr:trypsin-like peptidase domain-containing protein [Candidatus Udaeobacter sp.]
AVIKVDAGRALTAARIGNSDSVQVGDWAIAIGSPFGLEATVTAGIVSATGRDIDGAQQFQRFIQTDAAINPGNSGGPVVDLSGRLVGIASAKMAFTPQGVPTQGMGFAIPADVVRDSVNRFKQVAIKQGKLKGSPAPAEPSSAIVEKLFGMQLQDLSSELSEALGYLRGRGVLITAVEPDSPADNAGIKRGMVLYRVNKSAASSVRQVDEVLRAVESGANVEFTIGIIHARGENHELAALTLKAR